MTEGIMLDRSVAVTRFTSIVGFARAGVSCIQYREVDIGRECVRQAHPAEMKEDWIDAPSGTIIADPTK
jgi:hypothetical protein